AGQVAPLLGQPWAIADGRQQWFQDLVAVGLCALAELGSAHSGQCQRDAACMSSLDRAPNELDRVDLSRLLVPRGGVPGHQDAARVLACLLAGQCPWLTCRESCLVYVPESDLRDGPVHRSERRRLLMAIHLDNLA